MITENINTFFKKMYILYGCDLGVVKEFNHDEEYWTSSTPNTIDSYINIGYIL